MEGSGQGDRRPQTPQSEAPRPLLLSPYTLQAGTEG